MEKQNSPMPPKPAKILESNQKPALVLVHGFRGSPLGLEAIADDLRRAGFEVHTPALPPFAGAKFPIVSDYSPKSYARYLRDYIQDQHLVRPILIGHSMGSIVVAATAQRYPELVNQKLVLLSPISAKPARIIARISPLANYLPPRIVDYVTTKFLFIPHDKKLFRETIEITHRCSSDQAPSKSELTGAMKFSTGYSVADFLGGLQKDIIMIAGAKDRLISQNDTGELAEKYSAKLELISDSGHLHNYEKPHETAQLILKTINN